MDINQLKYYIEVCNRGSISAAAEALHISQQGVSLAVKRFEEAVGCTLLIRSPSGVEITEAGKIAYTEIQAALAHLEKLENLQTMFAESKYSIKVAIPGSMITRLPPALQQLLINGNEHYAVQLIDNEGYSGDIVDTVRRKDIPIGIVLGDYSETMDCRILDYIEQVFIVNRDNELARKDEIDLAELNGVPFVAPVKKAYPREQLQSMFDEEHLVLNVAYECNRPFQASILVMNNPRLVSRAVLDELSDVDLRRIKPLRIKGKKYQSAISLVMKPRRELNEFEQRFIGLIEACY